MLALPLANRLCANSAARLMIIPTLHLACRLTTLGLTSGAILCRTKMLWANHFALRLSTFHLAAFSIESLATCGTQRLVAYWTAMLRACWGIACPCAHWCTVFLSALFLHATAPLSPSTVTIEVALAALRSSLLCCWLCLE